MRLALDPGQTTGVGWRKQNRIEVTTFGEEEPQYIEGEPGELHGLQWPGESITVVLTGFHKEYGISELVIEEFQSRPGPAVNLSAVRVIGRAEEWAANNGVPIVLQYPSAVKRKVSKDMLRDWGGWIRGQEHARDALRHLLYREDKVGEIAL